MSFVEMWRWENGMGKTVEKVVEIVENMWRKSWTQQKNRVRGKRDEESVKIKKWEIGEIKRKRF